MYEESKKCKVQCPEDFDVAKVSVKRCLPPGGANGLISIEEKDLERVKKLLEKIKETGHLTMDSSVLEDSSDHATNLNEASDKV